MRLFIAIELSNGMRKELAALSRAVRERSCGGRFVSPENYHVTLRFIGESDDLAGAAEAMREACRGIRPFKIKLGSYGFFDKASRDKRTALTLVEGELDEMNVLHETLEAELEARGFHGEHRRFIPHITIGRNVEQDELAQMELEAFPLSSEMTVTGITLFESTREKGKVVYSPLHRESF